MINKKQFLSTKEKKESTLRKSLEEKYKLLKEDEFGEEDEFSDNGSEDDFSSGEEDDFSSEDDTMSDDMEGGEDDFSGEDDDFSSDFNEEEIDYLDKETDTLLEPAEEEAELAEQGEGDWDGDLSAEEIQSIIDSDDSYGELGTTLSSMADEDGIGGDDDFEEDLEFEGGEDEGFEGGEEGFEGGEDDFEEEYSDQDDLDEAMIKEEIEREIEEEVDGASAEGDKAKTKNTDDLNKRFHKKTEKVEESRITRQRKEKAAKAKRIKEAETVKTYKETKPKAPYATAETFDVDDFQDGDTDLEGTYSKVSGGTAASKAMDKPGKFSSVSNTVSTAKVKEPKFDKVHEAAIKSKMLTKASDRVNLLEKQVRKLQLESYRLMKANGILSTVGDKLDAESRVKISESFSKCVNKDQVNKLYEKVVQIIKEKSKPSLNEAVRKTKTSVKTTTVIKEAKDQAGKEDQISKEQQRINMLMGVPGNEDAYFRF